MSHSRVEREPYIHSSTGRREREIAAEEANGQPPAVQIRQQSAQQQQQQQRNAGQQRQQSTPVSSDIDEMRGNFGIHGFWECGQLCIFDVRITDTDARSHRHKAPEKVLADQEKEKKDKYLATCHEQRKDFTPLVYSIDGMAGREARMAEKRLASYLAAKWQRPYHQMVPYVRLRIRLSLVRRMSLLIRGSRDREPARGFVQSGSALHVRQTWEERLAHWWRLSSPQEPCLATTKPLVGGPTFG